MDSDPFFLDILEQLANPKQLLLEFISKVNFPIDNQSTVQVNVQPPPKKVSKYESAMEKSTSQVNVTNLESQISKFVSVTTNQTGEASWAVNKKDMPTLYAIWEHLKSISPSNASVERLFSKAKLIESDLRANILPENLECFLLARNFG